MPTTARAELSFELRRFLAPAAALAVAAAGAVGLGWMDRELVATAPAARPIGTTTQTRNDTPAGTADAGSNAGDSIGEGVR